MEYAQSTLVGINTITFQTSLMIQLLTRGDNMVQIGGLGAEGLKIDIGCNGMRRPSMAGLGTE